MSSFQNIFEYNIGDVVYAKHLGRLVKTRVEEVTYRRIEQDGQIFEGNAYKLQKPKSDEISNNNDERVAFIKFEQAIYKTFEDAVQAMSKDGGFMFATPDEITDFDLFKHCLVDATVVDEEPSTETTPEETPKKKKTK